MEPYTVQAEYSFQGKNNDELRFKKGDIITVTQPLEDGGWWEGTLGEVTGWFPSNYVKEYKAPLPLAETVRTPEEIQASRQVVLNDLLESERAHVAEIRGLFENFLEPLQTSQIVNPDEYAQLLGNFIEVVETHEELLTAMESSNDRIGKLFLTKAATMKCIHQAYCAAHPRAIVILDKHSEQLEAYMERQGAASPGLLVLTTGLSKPFRRLDKYAAMLQELERHMESGHPDRGDTQRSISIYKDIASMCAATRRQKELELQVLTGPVRNWQGQDLSTLGDIIHMGSVAVGSDHRDRYFVLFPHTLLILSVSQRMSAFIYEGKLPLTGITVNRLEDTETIKNAFEIGGPLIERITAVCQGPNEANKWVELLSPDPIASFKPKSNESLKNMSNSAMSSPIHTATHATVNNVGQMNRGAASMQASQHKRSLSFNHHLSYNQYSSPNANNAATLNHKLMNDPSLPPHVQMRERPDQPAPVPKTNSKANWSIVNLRPAPPLRPTLINTNLSSGSNGAILANTKKSQPTYEEDALVLRVIEAYCTAYQNPTRNALHSALQPWTPCLPIRGGKLKTAKNYSTSNPQLSFTSCASNAYMHNNRTGNTSCNSLNSSYIWREASPNNFNLYSSSVSSLNAGGGNASLPTSNSNSPYRYSIGSNSRSPEFRSVSEEKAITNKKSLASKFKGSSHYENVYMTPLLPQRKNKQTVKIVKSSQENVYMHNVGRRLSNDTDLSDDPMPYGLYDRRTNRSFEAPSRDMIHPIDPNNKHLRRSTPHLLSDDIYTDTDQTRKSKRHSATWCCGNFMLKQWKKVHQYD